MSVNILQDGNLLSIAGGGSTGHKILNEQGRIFPQRENLKFVNSDIQDDSVNNTTIITSQGGGGGSDPATPTTLGLVKPDNETILVNQQGVISANEFVGTAAQAQAVLASLEEGATVYITDDYEDNAVPIATTEVAGKVKPDGETITINQEGTIFSNTPIATSDSFGTVKPDNTTITINNGIISSSGGSSVPIATQSSLGIVKPDNTTLTINNGTLSVNNVSWANIYGKPSRLITEFVTQDYTITDEFNSGWVSYETIDIEKSNYVPIGITQVSFPSNDLFCTGYRIYQDSSSPYHYKLKFEYGSFQNMMYEEAYPNTIPGISLRNYGTISITVTVIYYGYVN